LIKKKKEKVQFLAAGLGAFLSFVE